MPGGVVTFIALSVILFAVLGSFLEGLPAIVLFGPLMFPIAAPTAWTRSTTRSSRSSR